MPIRIVAETLKKQRKLPERIEPKPPYLFFVLPERIKAKIRPEIVTQPRFVSPESSTLFPQRIKAEHDKDVQVLRGKGEITPGDGIIPVDGYIIEMEDEPALLTKKD